MSHTGATPTRSSRRQRREAPLEVSARAGSPTWAISALTDGSSAQRLRERREDRDRLTLAQLGNVASPVVIERAIPRYAPSALEEEEMYDMARRAEQAGASDSESDGESVADERNEDREKIILDAAFAAEEEKAALIPDEEVAGLKSETDEPWAYGAPVGWKPPGPPDSWQPNKPRNGEPEDWNTIDNPGGWSKYSFQAKHKYEKKGEYMYHCVPSGATPVPKDADGNRISNGWNFHYQDWHAGETEKTFCDKASRNNMFPDVRKGSL